MRIRLQILAVAIVVAIAGSAKLSAQTDAQENTLHAAAKSKVYKFRSVDYPGGTLSTVLDYEGGIAVGGTSFGNEPEIGFAYRGTTNGVIAYPGSSSSEASGVNASGLIVGGFADQNGVVHGFLYDGKTYATIDPPGSTYTYTLGVNERGVIVGWYSDGSGSQHGFVDTNGKFTQIDYPGSELTVAGGINAAGEIVGYYSVNYVSHGFLLSNGSFIEIDFPSMPATTVTGINDKGAIAGSYLDFNNVSHGFTLHRWYFHHGRRARSAADLPEAHQQ